MLVAIRTPFRRKTSRLITVVLATSAILGSATTAIAHDFWIIPDFFTFVGDSTVHISARQGTRFPTGTAVPRERVADARIIGAASQSRVTEMSVEGTALRLHQKPPAAGLYLIVVGLTPRTTRSTPAALIRYLRLEGGASEAARLERDSVLAGQDSVIYTAASYAETMVQVKAGGPRAFSMTAGLPLEFVPVNDPTELHVGDTLHVKVLGGGHAVPGAGIDATPAADTTAVPAQGQPSRTIALQADANGVVHLPLANAGPWIMRSAFVSRHLGDGANEWDVSRTTYVFTVGDRH